MEESASTQTQWIVFGKKIPKLEVVFFAQTLLIYIVTICALINLSAQNGDKNLWSILLGSSLGYMLPSPSLKVRTPKSTETQESGV